MSIHAVAAASAVLIPALALAQVPAMLGYQGRLMKADGTPETGLQSMGFALYSEKTGGASLWSETQSLALSDGYYTTALGDAAGFGLSLFDGRELFLEVSVAGTALQPRQRVVSVPYSLASTNARNVTGGSVNVTTVRTRSLSVDNASPQAGTGLVAANGTAVSGGGTTFTSQAQKGDLISIGSQTRVVASVASDVALTTETPFSPSITAPSPFVVVPAPIRVSDASKAVQMTVTADGNLRMSKRQIIFCSKCIGKPGNGVTMTYVPGDCGGTLPDADYVGAIASAGVCNGILTFGVIQPGSTDGPGVSAYAVNPCGNFCADAVFFRKW